MKNTTPLQKAAIEAAKEKDWTKAVTLNQAILNEKPLDLNALNRLALAQMQLNNQQEARQALEKVLEIDPNNRIAQKNLENINKQKTCTAVEFKEKSSYIEEPGKAKVIELIRAPERRILDEVTVGLECELEPKKTFISINTTKPKRYLGTLPLDISSRLIALITKGNQYSCIVHSVEPEQGKCRIFLKETFVSTENQGKTSFPISMPTGYQDPEIISLEHELKNDIPLELEYDEEQGQEDDVSDIEDSDQSLLGGSSIIDEDEDE